MKRFIVSGQDAVDLGHVVAIDTCEGDIHSILLDNGYRIGITEDLYRKIMAAIYNSDTDN